MRIVLALTATLVTTSASPTVLATLRLAPASAPCAAAAGGRYVWVAEYAAPYLVKIDPATNHILGKTTIGFGSCGLAYGAGSMWIEDTSSSTVSRVSVSTGRRLKAIPVGVEPYDTTFAYRSVWTTSHGQGDLERIDPATNRVANRWKLSLATGVVAAFGSLWATGGDGVMRVDPVSHRVLARIPVTGGAGWTAASADAVWVTTPTGLARIDPRSNAVTAAIPLAGAPYLGDPDVADGKVWVPQIRRNSIAIVDPAQNAVTQTVRAGVGPFVVTAIGNDVWVPSYRGRDVWRFKP